MFDYNHIFDIASNYVEQSTIDKINFIDIGNINDTYVISSISKGRNFKFVIQKLNTLAHPNVYDIAHNIDLVTHHISNKLNFIRSEYPNLDWRIPFLLPLLGNKQNYILECNSTYWRAMHYIYPSISYNRTISLLHASRIGQTLGLFHQFISDIPISSFICTQEPLHSCSKYIKSTIDIVKSPNYKSNCNIISNSIIKNIIGNLPRYLSMSTSIDRALSSKILKNKPVHLDPKINNMLFTKESLNPLSIIDLDTVNPGLLIYDIADCCRSACNLKGEDTHDYINVTFDYDIFRHLLRSYIDVGPPQLEDQDYTFLPTSLQLIPLELGLRFFIDYLHGNRYFKISYPDQNLIRAMVQFSLVRSLEDQMRSITKTIESFAK